MLEVGNMSSNQVLAEKLRSAREVVGFLFKKTKDDSMDEDMLDHVWNILNDAVGALLLPTPEPIVLAAPAPAPIIVHTSRPPRDASVCPCPLYQSCSVCKKFHETNNEGFSQYMNERLIQEIGVETNLKDIYSDYRIWLGGNPINKITYPQIREMLVKKFGPIRKRTNGVIVLGEFVCGVRILGLVEDINGNFIA